MFENNGFSRCSCAKSFYGVISEYIVDEKLKSVDSVLAC